jgi:glycosyltransferase involved in cell wall biosynthesis
MADTKKTHNVLIIAYYFPPMGLSGVQRTQKFVKYLPQFGWKPTVITVTPTGYFAQDYTLLEELKHLDVEIHRVGSLDPTRLFKKKGVVQMPSERVRKTLSFISDIFFIPDNKIGWKRKVLKTVDGLFKSKKFDIVFATSPPYTDFLIGSEIHKKYKIPLVLDYRDVWHEYPYKVYPTPLHKYLNYKLEKQILHSASKVITTNRRVKELLLSRYKFLNYNDCI